MNNPRESKRHKELKEKAKEILKEMGYNIDSIFEEFHIKVGDGKNFSPFHFWIDVAGMKNDKVVGIECGTFIGGSKLEAIMKIRNIPDLWLFHQHPSYFGFDKKIVVEKIYHLPYKGDFREVKLEAEL